MIEAFVLVRLQQPSTNPDLDFMQKVKKEIAALEGVKEVKGVFGLYDFVALVETGTAEELGTLITQTMRSIKGVSHTETMVVGF